MRYALNTMTRFKPTQPPHLFALLWPSYFNPLNLPYEIHLSLYLVPIQLHSHYFPPRPKSEGNYEVWWHPVLAKLYEEHKLLLDSSTARDLLILSLLVVSKVSSESYWEREFQRAYFHSFKAKNWGWKHVKTDMLIFDIVFTCSFKMTIQTC